MLSLLAHIFSPQHRSTFFPKMNRISMNIMNNPAKRIFILDELSFHAWNKQASHSVLSFHLLCSSAPFVCSRDHLIPGSILCEPTNENDFSSNKKHTYDKQE